MHFLKVAAKRARRSSSCGYYWQWLYSEYITEIVPAAGKNPKKYGQKCGHVFTVSVLTKISMCAEGQLQTRAAEDQ